MWGAFILHTTPSLHCLIDSCLSFSKYSVSTWLMNRNGIPAMSGVRGVIWDYKGRMIKHPPHFSSSASHPLHLLLHSFIHSFHLLHALCLQSGIWCIGDQVMGRRSGVWWNGNGRMIGTGVGRVWMVRRCEAVSESTPDPYTVVVVWKRVQRVSALQIASVREMRWMDWSP